MEKDEIELLKKITLLYVEDGKALRKTIASLLEGYVGELHVAADGREGLKLYHEVRPHVVITDIEMPLMDGLEMAAAIREDDRHIPIIVTTAYEKIEYLRRAIEIGIDKYVDKAIDPEKLIEAVAGAADIIIRQRCAEAEHRFIRLILDSGHCFMLTTKGEEIEFINNTFLNNLGFDDLDSFKEKYSSVRDFFERFVRSPYPGEDSRKMTRRIMQHSNLYSLVYFVSNKPEGKERAFIINTSRSSELDMTIYSFSDVTLIEEERQELEHQATRDGLTGVYNRVKFSSILLEEVSRVKRYKEVLSLIMFDIDNFKKVNDTYGHDVGDAVLMGVSDIITLNVREQDVFARWGGEEFMTIAVESDLEGAKLLAEKMRHKIETTDFGEAGVVTCSFGVTQFKKGESIEEMMKRVDIALYEAKGLGRNRVVTL